MATDSEVQWPKDFLERDIFIKTKNNPKVGHMEKMQEGKWEQV